MPSDRQFKEFLQWFLPQFLWLFFPEQAAQLDFSTLVFLDKELIVNLPGQVLRITDIVAEVNTIAGEAETIIVHVEVEARDRKTLSLRMYEYYSLLRILRRKRVLPIALVLLPDNDGVKWPEYSEALFGEELLRFRHAQIGIRGLVSEIYLQKPDAIAGALAVLMQYGKHHSAKVKLAGLRKIIESDLTEGDKLFLINFVETYLPKAKVPQDEEKVMQDLAQIEMTWVERALEEGKQEGKQELLLHLMTAKFGSLPDVTIAKVRAMTNDELLNTLSEQVLFAASLAEIVLPDPE